MKISNALSPSLIIFFAVGLRLLPHPQNMAPIAGMALFGGAYLNKKYALIVPLVAMAISDAFLGFHATMLFVYGSFLLTGCIGLWLRAHKALQFVVAASVLSSLLFFLITNFGVWAVGSLYPKTLVGLMESYVMGLPFFRNTLVGDLLYVGVFFGLYELIIRYVHHEAGNKHYGVRP